jgi:tetratricopeptide (TPR) repeat protein
MVAQDPSADKDDRVAATYNIGLYYEISGYLDQAEDYYDKAFKMSGDSKYLDSRARIQKRRKELERLQQQY